MALKISKWKKGMWTMVSVGQARFWVRGAISGDSIDQLTEQVSRSANGKIEFLKKWTLVGCELADET